MLRLLSSNSSVAALNAETFRLILIFVIDGTTVDEDVQKSWDLFISDCGGSELISSIYKPGQFDRKTFSNTIVYTSRLMASSFLLHAKVSFSLAFSLKKYASLILF